METKKGKPIFDVLKENGIVGSRREFVAIVKKLGTYEFRQNKVYYLFDQIPIWGVRTVRHD